MRRAKAKELVRFWHYNDTCAYCGEDADFLVDATGSEHLVPDRAEDPSEVPVCCAHWLDYGFDIVTALTGEGEGAV